MHTHTHVYTHARTHAHAHTHTHTRNATRARAGCTGSQSVTLSGPGPVPVSDGAGDYADNTQCTWAVTAAGPITVVFKAFATEADYDFVTLSDGTGRNASYSGVAVPPPFSTNATSLTIVLTTDGSGVSGGFELEVFALVPGGTWAPTAAPTDVPAVVPTTGTPTTAVPTYAPDTPGTSEHTHTPPHAHTFARTHSDVYAQTLMRMHTRTRTGTLAHTCSTPVHGGTRTVRQAWARSPSSATALVRPV